MKTCKCCGFQSKDKREFAIGSQYEVNCTVCFSWKAAVKAYSQAKDKIKGLVLQPTFERLFSTLEG